MVFPGYLPSPYWSPYWICTQHPTCQTSNPWNKCPKRGLLTTGGQNPIEKHYHSLWMIDHALTPSLSDHSGCSCPSACYMYEYDVTLSVSAWPSPGYETFNAWGGLIQMHKDWNYHFGTCQKFKNCLSFKYNNLSKCTDEDKVDDSETRKDLRFVFI